MTSDVPKADVRETDELTPEETFLLVKGQASDEVRLKAVKLSLLPESRYATYLKSLEDEAVRRLPSPNAYDRIFDLRNTVAIELGRHLRRIGLRRTDIVHDYVDSLSAEDRCRLMPWNRTY